MLSLMVMLSGPGGGEPNKSLPVGAGRSIFK